MNSISQDNLKSEHVRTLEKTISKLENKVKVYEDLNTKNVQSISFLNGLLEQSLAGIYAIDSNGGLSYVNQAFADIFHYDSPDEIIGKLTPKDFVAPECRDFVLENIKKRTLGQVKEMRYTFTGLCKDGSRNIVEVHGRSMAKVGTGRSVVGLMIDMTDYHRMSELAFYDSLTHLPNRALFNDRLKQIIMNAQRNHDNFALFFVDLDGFKAVNDTYGHATGDHVLKESAQRLLSLSRATDTVCRLGGDEFVIIFTGMNDRQIMDKTASDMLANLECPIDFQEHIVTVSACIGISIYPHNGEDMNTLLHNADTAMYKAKNDGKHSYSFAE